MRRLKILIDGRMIQNQVHGIGRYTQGLIAGLREKNQDVWVLSYKKSAEPESLPCRFPFAHPLESLELSLKTRHHNFDIVHFPSFAVPALMPERAVVTMHDLIHLYSESLPHKIYYQTIVKRALLSASAVIAVSEWAKEELERRLFIPREEITVIRNGIDPKFFSLEDSITEQKPFSFVALTNLKDHKNALTLIRAVQDLWKKNYDFNLELSLGGADIPEEWALTETERNKIHLFKNVSDQEIRTRIHKSRALISTSVYEGFNYPVAEALAMRKEVVLSLGSAHNEFKSNLVHFYGTPHDTPALIQTLEKLLVTDPLQSTGDNLKTLDAMVEETLELYRRVAYHFSL